jgi:small redox-active disulfide protein 2
MIIEICGTGCAKCHSVGDNVRKTLNEMGLKDGEDVNVTEIRDPVVFASRGVIFTPALMIEGEKVAEGTVPEVKDIKKWIEAKLPNK